MSQKSSVPQAISFVSQVLKRDTLTGLYWLKLFRLTHLCLLKEPVVPTNAQVAIGAKRPCERCS